MTVRVPLRPLDTGGSFGNRDVIVYGSYGGGEPAAAELSDTDAPHFLITGYAGSGRNTLVRNLANRGARIGCDVRVCDPSRTEMGGLRGWPNISRVETETLRMIQLVEDACDDMLVRYRDLEADRGREDSLQRIMLVIGDYPLFLALTSDLWEGAQPQPARGAACRTSSAGEVPCFRPSWRGAQK